MRKQLITWVFDSLILEIISTGSIPIDENISIFDQTEIVNKKKIN